MKIHVRSKQVTIDDDVRDYIERRFQLGLGRYSSRIFRVSVQIIDMNGPRGGADKACRVEVKFRSFGGVFVENTDSNLYSAVDRAADKAGRAVARVISRAKDLNRNTEIDKPAAIPLFSDKKSKR